MEARWQLPTPDGHIIYGRKNSAGSTGRAVFMVHGLTGNMNEYQFKYSADHFAKAGYDVFRFNLYDGEKGARQITDCTLRTHAEDLNTVIAAFGKEYEKTFVTGHSFGGPTVMLANPINLTAASLWDPSYNIQRMRQDFKDGWGREGPYHTISWGVIYLLGDAMVQHSNTLDEPACIQLSESFNAPVQVVLAGDGYYVKQQLSYDSHNRLQHERQVVPGTVHCFYEGNSCDDLIRHTLNWFDKF